MPNQNKQEPEGDLKTVVRKFANSLSFQLSPSNDTMEAIRLLTKELPALLHQEREKAVEKVKKLAGEYMNINDFNNFEDDLALLHPTNKTKE